MGGWEALLLLLLVVVVVVVVAVVGCGGGGIGGVCICPYDKFSEPLPTKTVCFFNPESFSDSKNMFYTWSHPQWGLGTPHCIAIAKKSGLRGRFSARAHFYHS